MEREDEKYWYWLGSELEYETTLPALGTVRHSIYYTVPGLSKHARALVCKKGTVACVYGWYSARAPLHSPSWSRGPACATLWFLVFETRPPGVPQ